MRKWKSKVVASAMAVVLALGMAPGLAFAGEGGDQQAELNLSLGAQNNALPLVVAAPLVDHGDGTAEDPNTPMDPADYAATVEASEAEGVDYDVAVTASGLVQHYNGGHMKAYWVGIGIQQQADATYEWGIVGSETVFDSPTSSFSKEGVTYDTFYWGALSTFQGKTGYVKVKVGETTTVYNVDFSGVTCCSAFDYNGNTLQAVKSDLSAFRMFAPKEGQTTVVDEHDAADNLTGRTIITFAPAQKVYSFFYMNASTTVRGTWSDGSKVSLKDDGTFEVIVDSEAFGKALPIAPISSSSGKPTSEQCFLALPSRSNLVLGYTGDDFKFAKGDLKSTFGMLTPQAGSLRMYRLDGKVHSAFNPSSTKKTYAGFYLKAATGDQDSWKQENYIAAKPDGTYDFAIDESYCGNAWPIAPVKSSDMTKTTKDQYYLIVPAAEKISEPVAVPAAKDGLVYNGTAQTGVETGTGFTLSGTTSATNAGNYEATATLNAGYVWSDGTAAAKVIEWSIAPAANPIMATASNPKAITYKTKAQTIANPLKVTGAQGAVSYAVSGSKYFTFNAKTGKIAVAKKTPAGTYKITVTVTAAGNTNYKSGTASKQVKVTVGKAKGAIKVTAKAAKKAVNVKAGASVSASKYAKVTKKTGSLQYAKAKGSKNITVAKNGKISVKKACKAGKYIIKVKVTSKASKNFKAASKTITVKLNVKK